MRALVFVLPLVLALPLALARCVSSSGGGGSTGDGYSAGDTLPPPASGPPIEAAQYCDRYTELACQTAVACDCLSGIGANVALCNAYVAQQCSEAVTQRVTSGAMSYDATRAGQCFAAIKTIVADCMLSDHDVLLYLASHCEDFLAGARRAGEACQDDDECLAPLVCSGEQCVALPAVGQPCLAGTTCADGDYCDAGDVCRAEALAGGPCGSAGAICASDLYCDSRGDTCQPYIARGGACAHSGAICGDDLYCDSRSDTCEPYIAQGGACGHATWACGDNLRCDSDSALCVPYPTVGQGCTAHGACADGLYCDALEICRQPAGIGAPCSDDEACASDNCPDSVCAPATSGVCTLL